MVNYQWLPDCFLIGVRKSTARRELPVPQEPVSPTDINPIANPTKPLYPAGEEDNSLGELAT
jgi:hypothetical protein